MTSALDQKNSSDSASQNAHSGLSQSMPLLYERAGTPSLRATATRSTRPSTLDASIQRELRRGEAAGMTLRPAVRELVDALVEQEIHRADPSTEGSLLAALPLFGMFRSARFQHRLELAIRLGLVRRDRATLRPTVAGIAAVRPHSLPASLRPAQDKLRELRKGEIGSF